MRSTLATVSAQTPTVAGSAQIGINGVAEVLKSPVLGRAGSSPALGISSYNWFTAEYGFCKKRVFRTTNLKTNLVNAFF